MIKNLIDFFHKTFKHFRIHSELFEECAVSRRILRVCAGQGQA